MIGDFLQLLKEAKGFHELEIKVLGSMLSLSQKKTTNCTASKIAREAKISVTNTYKYLYNLQEKGLVESIEGKNKIFWLTRSSNPFPRLLSRLESDHRKRIETLSGLEKIYGKIVKINGEIWSGQKIRQPCANFSEKSAFLLDAAKSSAFLAVDNFTSDHILIEAAKRAAERGVDVRVVTQEIDTKLAERLKESGISIKLNRAPKMAVIDGKHGVAKVGNTFEWFTHSSPDTEKFEEAWDFGDDI